MKTDKNPLKLLNVIHFLTIVCILLFLICVYQFKYELGVSPGMVPMIPLSFIFLPYFVKRVYKLSYDEIKYSIMAVLVIAWMFLLYTMSRIVGHVYGRYSGIMYIVCLIPVLILIVYLAHNKEWGNFYKSLTRVHLEDYIEKKAKERVKEIEKEFGEISEYQDESRK